MAMHKTTIAYVERPVLRPKQPCHNVTCLCGWGSYGHDTEQDAAAHGKRHEAERNR